MSLVTSTNASINYNVDAKTECLVYGYIRLIEIDNQIIPTTIINLCIQFYYVTLRIISMIRGGTIPNMIIVEMDQDMRYQCNIQPLSQSEPIDDAQHQITYCSGLLCIKNFQLPQEMISFYDKLYTTKTYNIIFAGGDGVDCFGYIIDAAQFYSSQNHKMIDVYCWNKKYEEHICYTHQNMV